MQYGTMNFPVKPLVAEIEEIGRLGFDYLELAMDPPEASPDKVIEQRDEIIQSLGHHNLGIVGHLPTFVNSANLYNSLRQASLREIFLALEVGVSIGMKKVVVHPGYVSGLGIFVKDRVKHYALEGIAGICKRANELGVTVCLENLPPGVTFWNDPEEFRELLAGFPELQLTLDIGHANIGRSRKKGIRFIQKYPTRIGHVHVSDNFGARDEHLEIGKGTVPFLKTVQALIGMGYDGTITIEVFTPTRDPVRESRDRLIEMFARFG